MAISPLTLMAGEGLLKNEALQKNPQLNISSYTLQPIVQDYKNTISVLEGNLYDPLNNPYGINQSTVDSFVNALDTKAPFLTDVIPLSYNIGTRYFSTFLIRHLSNLFPNNKVFVVYLQIAKGHKDIANQYVEAAVAGTTLGAATFTSMSSLITGGLTNISTDLKLWGQDLLNSGELFNFEKLETLGTPQGLYESLVKVNLYGAVTDELKSENIDSLSLLQAISENPNRKLSSAVQRKIYNAFVRVTDEQLDKILYVLQFKTDGIETLADLLDLKKVFPNSYDTIIFGSKGELYTGEEISPFVKDIELPGDLFNVLPDTDQIKVNYVFQLSLQQIKGIFSTTPKSLAQQALDVEIIDSPLLTGLTQALPDSTSNYIKSEMGGGSGPNGTFYLSDLIGSPAGIPHADNLTIINNMIAQLEASGGLVYFRLVLTTIEEVAQGNRDDGMGGTVNLQPGDALPNTSYPTRNDAILALIDELVNAISTDVSTANNAFNDSIAHILTELKVLADANIEFQTTYTNYDNPNAIVPVTDKKTILGFTENLHNYSNDQEISEILELMATSTQSGEAIVGALKEGRNLSKLAEANIKSDNLLNP